MKYQVMDLLGKPYESPLAEGRELKSRGKRGAGSRRRVAPRGGA